MRNNSQANGLANIMSRKPPLVLAVCSGKGGVGKSTIATNIAVALDAIGKDVCLLDADVSLANIDVLLGLQPRFNLSHVVSGEVDLESIILSGPGNTRIIPAASGKFCMTDLPPASQAAIIQAFSGLSRQPEILVVDTPTGISSAVACFVKAAQYPVVVVRDEPASLTDAYALIKVFSQNYGVTKFNIISNQSRTALSGRHLFDKLRKVSDSYLDVVLRHLGDIPEDRFLIKAVQEQRSVVDAYPQSRSGTAILEIARTINNLPVQRESGGGIEFFFERFLAAGTSDRSIDA